MVQNCPITGDVLPDIEPEEFRERCPHCGQFAPIEPLSLHKYFVYSDGESFQEARVSIQRCAFYIVKCVNCSRILVYHSENEVFQIEDYANADLVFPIVDQIHASIPQVIIEKYVEAKRIVNISPDAFVNQMRVALEMICEDQQATGGNLYQKLQNLANIGKFTPLLAEAANLIRDIGNHGSHAKGSKVLKWEVEAVDNFFKLIVEYVYIAPEKIRAYRESYESLKASWAEEN